jgi:hypothetical protein
MDIQGELKEPPIETALRIFSFIEEYEVRDKNFNAKATTTSL